MSALRYSAAALSGSTFSETASLTSVRRTVIAFISARCPISNAYNDRLSDLYRAYSAKGVRFLVVNANSNESVAEVADHARSAGFPFPVMKDNGNAVADLLGAMLTPDFYLLDAAGKVRYRGTIDDAQNPARVKVRHLAAALDAVLAGKQPERSETKAFGCTIKRVRKTT